MFSVRLARLRQFDRLTVLAVATLLAGGIVLIAVWTVRALKMLEAAEADRADHNRGGHRIGRSLVLCLIVYATVRAVGRSASR